MPTSARWAAANLPKISEKTVHPAGAMCKAAVRNAPSSRTAVTGISPYNRLRANLLCISIKIYSRPGVLGREHTCFVVPPKFGSGWTLPSCTRDAGCADPAISAQCALYACSADVLPGAAAKAFQRHGPLSGQAVSRYCFRVVAKIKIIGSFSCSSSSCANPDRRAAIRGSAFLPRPGLLRTGRWTSRTGEACA